MEELATLPSARTSIFEFSDTEIRKAFEFASSWSWFQQPGRSIFADRLYLQASRSDVDADLAEAVMRFLNLHGFVVSVSKLKWVVRKPFSSDLVDAACVAVAREKIAK